MRPGIKNAHRSAGTAFAPLSTHPLVSIIVPSFNQGRFIRATIDSILGQDYRPLTIHVIDGGSSDSTVNVLESYGRVAELDWVSEPDRGVVEAVNKGFNRARGDILAIQSSDDMYLPGAIRVMVNALRQRPNHGLLYADIETVDEAGTVVDATSLQPFSIRGFLSKQTWIPQPSAFFRREMLDACGGWDERYFNADTELWLRMVFRTEVEKIDATIAQRRRHDQQRDHQARKIVDSYRRMIADSADVSASDCTIRRAAKAGTHLHAIRYNPRSSYLVQSYHLWRALAHDPSLWQRYRSSPLLVPGWLPLRVLLSRCKQYVSGGGARVRVQP